MNVNGITATGGVDYNAYTATQSTVSDTAVDEAASAAEESGVIYEKSEESGTDSTAKTYTANTELVNKLKADAEARTAQLQNLVNELLTKQYTSYGIANSDDDSMWQFLASGDYTVDAATKAQAQADIADGGYWSVEETAQRILDFAKALSGGDADMLEELRDAFEEGFSQATSSWGSDLPSISQQTYDAVMSKFDEWAEEAGVASTESIS